MDRKNISVDVETHAFLRKKAFEENTSIADLIRKAFKVHG